MNPPTYRSEKYLVYRFGQPILGHPQSAPTLAELDYMNPSIPVQEIEQYLGELEEKGLVDSFELPEQYLEEELPGTYYRLTTEGREIFDQYNKKTYTEQERIRVGPVTISEFTPGQGMFLVRLAGWGEDSSASQLVSDEPRVTEAQLREEYLEVEKPRLIQRYQEAPRLD